MHLIVGVDPGKTSAIACLSLDGRLVFASHKTFAGLEWLANEINKIGTPSLIACDREPGELAKKLAAAFNVPIHAPEKEIPISEKIKIGKSFGVRNPHERDACTAALKAYNRHVNKLNQAAHLAKENNMDIDAIRAKVIERYSIDEAINDRMSNRW